MNTIKEKMDALIEESREYYQKECSLQPIHKQYIGFKTKYDNEGRLLEYIPEKCCLVSSVFLNNKNINAYIANDIFLYDTFENEVQGYIIRKFGFSWTEFSQIINGFDDTYYAENDSTRSYIYIMARDYAIELGLHKKREI